MLFAAAVAAAAVGLGARWRPFRVAVEGGSMAPALEPGDWVIATRARPRRGSVVVIEHPDRPGVELVKRVVAGPGDRAPGGSVLGPREWWVTGDAGGASTDSRTFGPVPAGSILGVARLVYWPPSRRRLLSRR